MTTGNLSERLQLIAEEIPQVTTLADIGTDHAYMPCYACQQGLAKQAIAGDVADGPLTVAYEQIKAQQLQDVISVRKGDGLSVLTPHEADVIVIAGMGGSLIRDILQAGIDRLAGVQKLILQPNIGTVHVRSWLRTHGWRLHDEHIIYEDDHFYDILTAVPGDGEAPYRGLTDFAMTAGPYLMQARSQIFCDHWYRELQKWQRIDQQLQQAQDTAEKHKKRRDIAVYIQQIREMIG